MSGLGSARLGLGNKPWLFLLFALFVFSMINRHQWASDMSHSADDAVYLSYAMSFGIDADMDFSNELLHGNYRSLNKRGLAAFWGAGAMAAPFVGLFSLADRLLGNPVIEDRSQFLHSWSYFGFSFAVHFYFLASVLCLWQAARRIAPPAGLPLAFLLTASSGILYFVLTRPTMTHAFEFFALALVLLAGVEAWSRSLDRQGFAVWSALAAIGTALCVAVRLSDLNVLALAPLAFLSLHLCRGGALDGAALFRQALLYGLFLCLAFLPVGAMNLALWDAALPTEEVVFGVSTQVPVMTDGYPLLNVAMEWLTLLPNMLLVLFGMEFGLLYTAPLSVLGIALLFFLLAAKGAKGQRFLRGLALAVLALYIISSLSIAIFWKSTASSYGFRYLYPLFPLGFLGYLMWWQAKQNLRWRSLVHTLLVGLCLFSCAGQFLFSKSEKLSYYIGMSSLGREAATRPDFVSNLVLEVANPGTWGTAFKDGLYGFVTKMYLNKRFFARLTGRDAGTKNWEPQHPPVDGLFILLLATMWFGTFRFLLARGTATPMGWGFK